MPNLRNRILALLAAAMSLTACGKDVPIAVRVVKPNECGVGPDPFENVTHLRLRAVDDQGLIRTELVVERSESGAEVADIPSGALLRLEVAGFNGQPSDKKLVSWGQSAPFTVPAETTGQTLSATVFLRAVDRFSPVNSAEAPGTCTTLSASRAGHSATLLDDGRVLIAGGFDGSKGTPADPTTWDFHETVEVFDPATGLITTDSPPMNKLGPTTKRAFHAATRLPSGQVLVTGGEYATGGSTKTMAMATAALLFDATVDGGKGQWIPLPGMRAARSRHTATLDGNGRVILVGGVNWTEKAGGAFVKTLEWFDPDSNKFKEPAITGASSYLSRVGHGAVLMTNNYVSAAGGVHVGTYDSSGRETSSPAMASPIKFIQYRSDSDSLNYTFSSPNMSPVRSWVSAALLGGDSRYLVLGGFTGFSATKPFDLRPEGPVAGTNVVAVVQGGGAQVVEGPTLETPRGHICSVTLRDGRVLAIGGLGKSAGAFQSQGATHVFSIQSDSIEAAPTDSLLTPRHLHTCTLLPDGTVLVAGGVEEKDGKLSHANTLEIYVPRPPGE